MSQKDNTNAINKKPFRLSKNGKPNNIFIPNGEKSGEIKGNINEINLGNQNAKSININLIHGNFFDTYENYENEMEEDQKE